MKICLIGPYFGYPHSVVKSLEKAAEVLGHETVVVDPEASIRNKQSWVHKVLSHEYDFILCSTINGLHKILKPEKLAPRILWVREEIRRPEVQRFMKDSVGFYNKTYYFDLGGKAILEQLGVNLSILPLCMDPKLHYWVDGKDRDLDILFIGSLEAKGGQDWYQTRKIALQKMETASLRVTALSSWDAQKNSELYSQAKIAFNLGAYFADYGPPEDLRASGYQDRSFEAMASGALLFNHKIDKGRIFTPGKELIEYEGKDLVDLLKESLSKPDKAREIAEEGYQQVRRLHTYKNRLAKVVEDVKKMV